MLKHFTASFVYTCPKLHTFCNIFKLGYQISFLQITFTLSRLPNRLCVSPIISSSLKEHLFTCRCAKDRLRGYFRFSNRKLRQSCETVISTAGTPAALRAGSHRSDGAPHQLIEEGQSDTNSYQQDLSSSWLYSGGLR